MSTKNLLQQLFNKTKDLAGFSILYFKGEIQLHISESEKPVCLWAITANKDGSLLLLNSENQWYQLEETDRHFNKVAAFVLTYLMQFTRTDELKIA